jgi:hypothetical protein
MTYSGLNGRDDDLRQIQLQILVNRSDSKTISEILQEVGEGLWVWRSITLNNDRHQYPGAGHYSADRQSFNHCQLIELVGSE